MLADRYVRAPCGLWGSGAVMHLDSFVDSSTVWIVYLLKFHCREQGGQMQDFHVLGF